MLRARVDAASFEVRFRLLKMPKVKRYMWKGKVVTEKVYNQRLAQRNTGKHNLKTRDENTSTAEKESTDEEQKISNEPGEGRRIVYLKFLGKQLWCTSCKESLSLDNIEQEERRGLGSVLLIRCHKCLLVNPVVTGKQHTPPGKSRRDSRFDVNTKLAIGQYYLYSKLLFIIFQKQA